MNMKKIFGKKLVKNAQAVSPIIATLMLVLVAVGSAGAFYVWQSGWQGGIEDKVAGSGELQASLTIGGSTTVYEFSAIAAEYYEAANPNYKISYQGGGSGSGVAAVGMGAIDIGSASRAVKDTELAKYPDLNKDTVKDFGKELVTHTVAWDAVVIMYKGTVQGAATAATFATGESTVVGDLLAINDVAGTVGNGYTVNIVTGGLDSTGEVVSAEALNTITITCETDGGGPGVDSTWADVVIAANAAGIFGATVSSPTNGAETVVVGDAQTITLANGADAGFTYDFSDGVDSTELINAINENTVDWYDRSDASGTEELFVQKLLGLDHDTVEEAEAAGDISNLATKSCKSNQDIIAELTSATDAWTFMSYGMAKSTTFNICDYDSVEPTKDTIMGKVTPSYAAARPINYITVGDPTGDISQYIDFCLQPGNNQDICNICDYISIYA